MVKFEFPVKEFQDNPQNISVLHVGVALREPYGLKKRQFIDVDLCFDF